MKIPEILELPEKKTSIDPVDESSTGELPEKVSALPEKAVPASKQIEKKVRWIEDQPPIKQSKELKPNDLEKVCFVKEYETDIPRLGNPNAFDMRLYRVGEVAEFQHWRVESLLERGIVELAQSEQVAAQQGESAIKCDSEAATQAA